VWARSEAFGVKPLELARQRDNFGQLLTDAVGAVYFAPTYNSGLVARLDPASGEPQPYADVGDQAGDLFMDGTGKLYYVRYDAERRRKGWARYDPHTQQEEVHWGDDSVYGFFNMPIGIDGQGRCYSAMGPRFTCLTREAEPLWQELIDNVVVTGDAVYASESHSSGVGAQVVIRQWDRNGTYAGETVLSVPSPPAHEGLTRWRLVSRNDAGRFHVRGGAAPEEAVLVYSPRGELETIMQPSPHSPATEFRLQGSRTWSVDLNGAVYMPILGPAAFHLVKLVV
jgi:hypothetical protein